MATADEFATAAWNYTLPARGPHPAGTPAWVYLSDVTTNTITLQAEMTALRGQVEDLAKLVEAIALAAGDPAAIEAQVRQIVREELDTTLWQSRPPS